MMLSSLPKLDAVRRAAALEGNISRRGNIDVIPSVSGADEGEEVAICHLIYFMPFSLVDEDGNRTSFNEMRTFESGVAVLLAAQHLNAGDSSLVPKIDGIRDASSRRRCPIRFTVEMIDTEFVESTAVNSAINLTERVLPDREPCAIIGAVRSAVSIPTSIISGLRGYPQVSGMSTSAALDDKTLYPLFARTVPSDISTAAAAVLYLRNVLGIRYISMIHTSDTYGTAYARGMRGAVAEFAPDLTLVTFILRYKASQDEVENIVSQLRETQSRYFFGVLFPSDADAVLTEAVRQGIAATSQHNWLFSDAIGSIDAKVFERDSVLRRVYPGTSVVKATAENDRLAKHLRELRNEEDLAYFKSILPWYQDGSSIHTDNLDDSSFLSSPGLWAGFLYDAAIALGLSACDAAIQNGGSFTGVEHFNALTKNLTFNGITGRVAFDPTTGTREMKTASFEVVNFVENDKAAASTDMVQFKAVQTDIFQGGEWNELQPYVFNDGTTNVPPYLPDMTVDTNYIDTGLRAAGLTLGAVILMLSIGFSIWAQLHQNKKVVRASQPIFLHIMCTGTFLLGSSIIPLSIDQGVASPRGANVACMAFPWLAIIGFSTTFSAIYSKTHRINIIFKTRKFRRVTVKPIDVAKPMIAVLGVNILFLALWSALAPLVVTTDILAFDPFNRVSATYDYCDSDGKLPYLICIAIINFLALFLTTYEAYRAKDIPLEFAESEYIFKAMACIVMVCFIGIPVIFIAKDNPSAFFFVCTGIIFISSCCVLLMIFIPKILKNQSNNQPDQAQSHGVKILSYHTSRMKLVEENTRLKQTIIQSNRNLTSGGRLGSEADDEKRFQFHDEDLYEMNKCLGQQ